MPSVGAEGEVQNKQRDRGTIKEINEVKKFLTVNFPNHEFQVIFKMHTLKSQVKLKYQQSFKSFASRTFFLFKA